MDSLSQFFFCFLTNFFLKKKNCHLRNEETKQNWRCCNLEQKRCWRNLTGQTASGEGMDILVQPEEGSQPIHYPTDAVEFLQHLFFCYLDHTQCPFLQLNYFVFSLFQFWCEAPTLFLSPLMLPDPLCASSILDTVHENGTGIIYKKVSHRSVLSIPAR